MGIQQMFIGGQSPLAANVSSVNVSATVASETVTSDPVTCTASGGSGSYTYSWVKVSGGAISAVSPSSAATQFTASGMRPNETRNAVFRCDVSDGFTSVSSQSVAVELEMVS